MEPLAVDVREAARLVSLSPFTVRRYIKRGLLRAVRVGRRVLVPLAECERIAREGVTGGQSPEKSADSNGDGREYSG
jgi:excisionase family DNA binding protein